MSVAIVSIEAHDVKPAAAATYEWPNVKNTVRSIGVLVRTS